MTSYVSARRSKSPVKVLGELRRPSKLEMDKSIDGELSENGEFGEI